MLKISSASQLMSSYQSLTPFPYVQDLWLASQAIQHGYHLLTRNRRDFADVPGLDLSVM